MEEEEEEGWGRRLGGGGSKRKWDSIKLCQGQFAVNGPLHLAALSQRGRMLPGASLHCMLGGARPLPRQSYTPVLLCKFSRVDHIMIIMTSYSQRTHVSVDRRDVL